MLENVSTMWHRKRGATLLPRKSPSWLQLHSKHFEDLVNWMYLQGGNIDFREDILEQLCNAWSCLWDTCERGIVKLINRLGPEVDLWGDASLWLSMLRKVRVPN